MISPHQLGQCAYGRQRILPCERWLCMRPALHGRQCWTTFGRSAHPWSWGVQCFCGGSSARCMIAAQQFLAPIWRPCWAHSAASVAAYLGSYGRRPVWVCSHAALGLPRVG